MDYPEKITYSVVIPVYNSSHSLYELEDRLNKVFAEKIKATYEVIFIDDASPGEEAWKAISEITSRNREFHGIQLSRNFGKPGAVMCGFKYARGAYIILMDDDLQHLPEDIPLLIEQQHHDVVIGRFRHKKHSVFKRITSAMKNRMDYKLLGKPKHIQNTAFKLVKRQIVESTLQLNITYPYISALLFFATRDIVNVEVTHEKRKYGRTGYNLKRLLKQFSNFVFNNSSVLLRMVAVVGFLFSLASFVLIVYFVIKKVFVGIAVPGWTSTIIILLLTSGLVMLSLGILGEYFIRIINGIEKRPAFIVREKTK
jgi:glycosyltransferase involved in cell wall biosynthesis